MNNKEEIIARETLGDRCAAVILEVLRSKALLIAICTVGAVLRRVRLHLLSPTSLLRPNRHSDRRVRSKKS